MDLIVFLKSFPISFLRKTINRKKQNKQKDEYAHIIEVGDYYGANDVKKGRVVGNWDRCYSSPFKRSGRRIFVRSSDCS